MNRIILLLIAIAIGLSANADYTIQTSQPVYPAQTYGQQYIQPYNQVYNQNPYYQNQNPYQYQAQCVNPYQYQNSYYGYGNNSPYTGINPALSTLSGLGNTGGTHQIVKNIGQSMLYSMLRGY